MVIVYQTLDYAHLIISPQFSLFVAQVSDHNCDTVLSLLIT